MLRIMKLANPDAAKAYYRQSDYYLEVAGEWMGDGAGRLGLTGTVEQADFEAACDNINPRTGEGLTEMTVEGRRVGWDVNYNASKSVGLAREIIGLYDPAEGQSIEDAHREAVSFTMGRMEKDIACRVRVDGKDEDRVTGNMIAMRVTHRTTRPNEDDRTPDPELHDHVCLINATFDDAEGKVKAVQNERLYERAPYYEAMYHNRLAANLKALGYGVVRRGKGFEIAGITQELIDKFSRRKDTIEKKARELGIDSDAAKGRLGATTRLGKSEAAAVDLPGYWDGKLTDAERELLLGLKGRAGDESTAEKAVAYAIAHEFQRKSVLAPWRLYETAIRHGIGSVTPEDVEAEAKRQGLLFKGDECSTQAVLDQEQRIIGFARQGKGTCRPLADKVQDGLDGLSDEQRAAVRHVWDSTDQVMLIRGGAGTGKTTAMTPALSRLGAPVVLLAPSAQASRTTLRGEKAKDAKAAAAFRQADTVAAFLGDRERQETVKNGGIIWVDEAGMLAIDDLDRLCGVAKELNARVVLQGDPAQHRAVDRDGNMLEVLEAYAGLPVARLTQIQRQRGEYAGIVAAIRDRQFEQADARLRTLGWVVEGEGHSALVAEYGRAIEEKGPDGKQRSVIVIDPTHKDGDRLTGELRQLRREKKLVTGADRTFSRLVQIDMTDAQKGDARRYGGEEVIQFFRNTGTFKAGQRVAASELLPHLDTVNPKHFAAFRKEEVQFAVGDTIRITNNGRDTTGQHRLDNGTLATIKRFSKDGGIVLENGWVIGKEFSHFRHGLVETSPASQSKTMDIVLTALNRASLGAMSARQAYVTISRGRARGMVFTDLARDELLAAIARDDSRKSATELFGRRPEAERAALAPQREVKPVEKMRTFMEKVRHVARQLQRKAASVVRETLTQQELGYGR
jgi:conjugative relaxase-like TrwC/TraI family protein